MGRLGNAGGGSRGDSFTSGTAKAGEAGGMASGSLAEQFEVHASVALDTSHPLALPWKRPSSYGGDGRTVACKTLAADLLPRGEKTAQPCRPSKRSDEPFG